MTLCIKPSTSTLMAASQSISILMQTSLKTIFVQIAINCFTIFIFKFIILIVSEPYQIVMTQIMALSE
jgi:hypothetical protein